MLANPSKFQSIFSNKSKESIDTSIVINNKIINSQRLVNLLGLDIDDKLKFDSHISNLCKKAGGQLNSLYRFRKYLSPSSKILSINSFILSNFSYCPLVWHFSTVKSKNKIEQIQKRALKFLGHTSENSLKSLSSPMEVKRLRTLAIEIYKTLNSLNPEYMKDLFCVSNNWTSERFKFNIESKTFRQIKYGRNSLRVLAPILWNSLPNDAKSLPTLEDFKEFIQKWGTNGCPLYKKFKSYVESTK